MENNVYRVFLRSIGRDIISAAESEKINWSLIKSKLDDLGNLVYVAEKHIESGSYSVEEVVRTGVGIAEVTSVEPLENYRLRVTLSNGKKGIFDVSPYLEQGVFVELKDPQYFRQVCIDNGTVIWPHEQDIAPETIELELQPEPTS